MPALPSAWREGYIKGLRARGGYTVDITWEAGKLMRARVLAEYDGLCKIRYCDKALQVSFTAGVPVFICFDHNRHKPLYVR
ncbi:glycoside hydrolase family 95-like protein [Paenibacillus sp. DMB20]|uniref:glycoside hydrolase family 95-like protein n=1 Tax=Paenibacillus sp. DMB20 TaxID=1642570 RepID=UPI003FA5FC29